MSTNVYLFDPDAVDRSFDQQPLVLRPQVVDQAKPVLEHSHWMSLDTPNTDDEYRYIKPYLKLINTALYRDKKLQVKNYQNAGNEIIIVALNSPEKTPTNPETTTNTNASQIGDSSEFQMISQDVNGIKVKLNAKRYKFWINNVLAISFDRSSKVVQMEIVVNEKVHQFNVYLTYKENHLLFARQNVTEIPYEYEKDGKMKQKKLELKKAVKAFEVNENSFTPIGYVYESCIYLFDTKTMCYYRMDDYYTIIDWMEKKNTFIVTRSRIGNLDQMFKCPYELWKDTNGGKK